MEAACAEVIGEAFSGALAKTFSSLYDDPKPLPAQYLDHLPALYSENVSSALYEEVAKKFWDGGRYLDAESGARLRYAD
jgi:hypothetical protein